jgi:hypothetical protein
MPSKAQRQPATPNKAAPAPDQNPSPTPSIGAKDFDMDRLLGEDSCDDDLQMKVDHSITRELEGVGYEIGGVQLRPLSMSAVMRLHQVGNEIMSGKQVKDMANPLYACAEFLYSLALENDHKDVIAAAFGPAEEWRMLVSEWAETVAASETLISEIIGFVNDATSTRVKARLPKAMKGGSSEGNGFPRLGR